MTSNEKQWLNEFADKLQDAAFKAKNGDAKIVLIAKAGTANFIREKLCGRD